MSLITPLLTFAASGVIAAVIAYRLNATKEHVLFMRSKAEELYLAVDKYDRHLIAHFVVFNGLLENKISYNELYDINSNKDGKTADRLSDAYGQLQMLVNIYFPNVKSVFDRYFKARGAVQKILAEHKHAYEQGHTDGTPWLEQFNEAVDRLEDLGHELKQAAINEAAALVPAERLWPQPFTIAYLIAQASHIRDQIKARRSPPDDRQSSS